MKVFRAGVIYTLGNIATSAVPFALLPILTRVLSPAEYGSVVIFSLITLICTPFAGLSVSGAVGVSWFKRSKEECASFTGSAIFIIGLTTIVTAAAAFVILIFAPVFNANVEPSWGTMAAVTAGMVCLLQCRLSLWQSQQRPFLYVSLQFASSVCNVGLSLLFVTYFGWGAEGRNIGIAMAAILVGSVSVFLLVQNKEAKGGFARADLSFLLRYGIPLIPHALSGALIGTADRLMVFGQLGDTSLGIYSAGAQLGMVMAVVADACSKAYGPWLYARLASDSTIDKRAAVGAIYFSIPFFLLLSAGIGLGLYLGGSLLLGSRYQAGLEGLPWFVLGGAFTGIYLFITNLFFFSGRTSMLSLSTTASAAAGMTVTWFAIRNFGILGAAVGFAVTQAFLAIAVFTVALRIFDLPWSKPQSQLLRYFTKKRIRSN